MTDNELFKAALKLKPQEKYSLIEGLLKSLDEPNPEINAIWANEAEKRLNAYREGRMKGTPMGDIFKNNIN